MKIDPLVPILTDTNKKNPAQWQG